MTNRKGTMMTTQEISRLTDDDIYLFNEGTQFKLYEKLGAHPGRVNGVEGRPFRSGRRMRSGSPSSETSTIGSRMPIRSSRAGIPGFGKVLLQGRTRARSINIIFAPGILRIGSIRPIPSRFSTKFPRKRPRSSGTLPTSGTMRSGCGSGRGRMLSMHRYRCMRCMSAPGDGSRMRGTDR